MNPIHQQQKSHIANESHFIEGQQSQENYQDYSPQHFNTYYQPITQNDEEPQDDYDRQQQIEIIQEITQQPFQFSHQRFAQYEEEQQCNCSSQCSEEGTHCHSCASQQKTQKFICISKKKITKSKRNQIDMLIDESMEDFSIRKNFPKLLGTHFLGYLKLFSDEKIPMGIKVFQEKVKEMRKARQQLSFAIQDFRQICLASEECKQFFIDFLLNKLMVRLMHSSKFTKIEPVLDLISNAFVGASNPEKWKGNRQIAQPQ